ncbi:MAG: glycosyltransferase [Sedimentisphaerales bacterium]
MKKTLIICGHYPLPEINGANMRTMNFVRFFRKQGTVDIAYSHLLADAQTGDTIFDDEYLLHVRKHDSHKKRLLRGFLQNTPVPIYDMEDDSRRLLLTVIANNRYDYILGRYLYCTRALFDTNKQFRERTIIDFDDILSGKLYASRYGSVDGICKKAILNMNRRLLRHYENRCLTFGASLFCSETDQLKMNGRLHRNNAFVVPNVYRNESFHGYSFGDGYNNGHILLFVGTLSYKPNTDGLHWFSEVIFPAFKNKYPDARLLVVGHSPTPEITAICGRRKGIELHANVPDIRAYYRRCRAVVVPLLAGGGTKIKILEAAMAGRPVISTAVGAEGLELSEARDIMLFETADEFIARYETLDNQDSYNTFAVNAKELVLARYSIKMFDESMEEVLDAIDKNTALKNDSTKHKVKDN